jgi:hypothetical protein
MYNFFTKQCYHSRSVAMFEFERELYFEKAKNKIIYEQ